MKTWPVCAFDSAPSLMNLAESKSFQVGFSTSATGGCWLVGFRSGGQSAPDTKGICSSSSLLMVQVQDKVHTGQATGSGCSLVNPDMQQISIKGLRTLGQSCHNH